MEIFILGGYGQFVWPAFIFTFLSCFFLFVKTKKELKKHETLYAKNFDLVNNVEIKKEKILATKEILSNSTT
tara:strand:- start:1238 stop:1453 length:216 start_codon:yes stop_codon:yes gene_type:complete